MGKRSAAAMGPTDGGADASPAKARATESSSKTPKSSKKKVSKRYFTSLGVLTTKFVTLIRSSNGMIDLNSVAVKLGVQKRRIYDITNVLDGIGLIEKKPKGFILWKGHGGSKSGKDKEQDDELHGTVLQMQKELQALNEQEQVLDDHIHAVTEAATERLEESAQHKDNWAYVTSEELCSIKEFADQTIIVIRAKKGTTLEVPDPDEGTLGDLRLRRSSVRTLTWLDFS
mgnify:CR=1 FL=1